MRLIVLMLFLSGCSGLKCEEKKQDSGKCCTECFDHGALTIRSRPHACP